MRIRFALMILLAPLALLGADYDIEKIQELANDTQFHTSRAYALAQHAVGEAPDIFQSNAIRFYRRLNNAAVDLKKTAALGPHAYPVLVRNAYAQVRYEYNWAVGLKDELFTWPIEKEATYDDLSEELITIRNLIDAIADELR